MRVEERKSRGSIEELAGNRDRGATVRLKSARGRAAMKLCHLGSFLIGCTR